MQPLTFLFTDIEGSTQRWEADEAAMAQAVLRHDLIVRAAIERNEGKVFKTVGDAFCATFINPEAAAAACMDAQRDLGDEDFGAVGGLHVRMAIHTGASVERDGDYFGPTVNRVARLLAIGHGDQILISAITGDSIADRLAAASTLRDLGSHRLKDLTRPEHVYQLVAPGLREKFPPLRSLGLFPNNLPLETTSFIGRESEVGDVVALMARHRLVTLVGSGGVGKTRVSLHAAAQVLEEHRDGVWFVELASLTEGRFIPEEIAATLGLRLPADGDPLKALVAAARPMQMLLVLDNCEHLIADAAAVVSAMLREAPGLRVLATSRQGLDIMGEAIFRMPSLSLPTAIELFVTRAQAADARFELTGANESSIADICMRLDGIALAIELAAARVKILSPAQLRERLDERFRVLTGGSRDVLPRQQTLRALIDWSYDLLSEKERRAFESLAIFSGGWTLEAAERTVADERIDALELVDLLESLVEKSLVSTELYETQTRYRFLESTRSYALEKLAASSGLQQVVARRHACWVAEFAESAEESHPTMPRAQWLPEVEVELDNARAAMTWALGDRGDPTLAARIASALRQFWNDAGFVGEGRRWLLEALERVDAIADRRIAARLWHSVGFFSVAKQRVDAGERALELSQEAGDRLRAAACHGILAEGYRQMGRMEEAEAHNERTLELYRELGMPRSKSYAVALDSRALLLHAIGRIDEARSLYAEASELYKSLGDEERAMTPRMYLADLEFRAGNASRALSIANDAIVFFAQRNNLIREANARANAAAYRLALGEVDEVAREARASLALCERLQSPQMTSVAIEHLANVAAARGQGRTAARLSGYVNAWYASEGLEREWTEQQCQHRLVASLDELLPQAELARYLAEGHALSEAEATAEALEVCGNDQSA
ncbi:MAG TPA: adenylate/guanylate cyclase domain-containing protein [Candidatus Babeliales bacterium]|nr:adenylate/guanylate cyclase domain-containing protein [Candidatus Babeliales bacterium]